ncbi:hypothetical protein [Clostridium sp. DL1XJH146]
MLKENYDFEVYPVYFEKNKLNDLLIIYRDKMKYQVLVNIVSYDFNLCVWKCIYSKYYDNYGDVEFYNKKWELVKKNKVLVLYSPGVGSGGFISYTVLGKKEDRIIEYVKEENIFGGSIFFKGKKLIRGTGNQFRVWIKENNNFKLAPYRMETIEGAVVIKYSIVDENKVNVEKLGYSVEVGDKIQLIREDFNEVIDRTLISDKNRCTEFITYGVFKVTCETMIDITIIPGGYNWDGAVSIRVNAN